VRKNQRRRIKKIRKKTGVAVSSPERQSEAQKVTILLRRLDQGDRAALPELYPLVESELRRIAEARLSREKPRYNLQTTLLIDDAFRKLIGEQHISWENRAHFYRLAARVMRQLVVDAARKEGAGKRGAGQPAVPLEQAAEPVDRRQLGQDNLLELDDALTRLESTHPHLAEVVQMHHFGGYTFEELAGILQISEPTLKRRWKMALAFLHRALRPGKDDHGS
jgi:RNA polymerase sigma factor (TIGR02999 family)